MKIVVLQSQRQGEKCKWSLKKTKQKKGGEIALKIIIQNHVFYQVLNLGEKLDKL